MTAGVIESELGAKSQCDVERYYAADSAYRTVADAIKRRMEVPLQVLLLCPHVLASPSCGSMVWSLFALHGTCTRCSTSRQCRCAFLTLWRASA